jgi:hypothetical protein
MHLIAPLASGLVDAANGSVTLYERGTTIVASYYSDFEATQLLSGQSVLLDSNGSLVAYVAVLVDVEVKNDLGVVVREFVAGAHDAAVEVISPSFTGVDYTSGASGTQKPTDLERVLDSWMASAGAPDWKVLANGSPTTLQVLAGNSFINVKAYGAQGNGVSDDTTAIVAANAAATALGGGNVYWPPGTYRVTAAINLPANVTWVGAGGLSTKLAIDSGAGAGAVILPAAPAGSGAGIVGMWVGAINGVVPGVLLEGGFGATGDIKFVDCVFGNDALSNSNIYSNLASLAALKVTFLRCYLKANAGATPMVQQGGLARLTMRDCDIINGQAQGIVHVRCDDGGLFEGNRFDGSVSTAGAVTYLQIAPATYGMVAVVGNQFAANLTVPAFAIHNTLAAPNRDCMEYGNVFGDVAVGPFTCTPYLYNTDGYCAIVSTLPTSGHGSRYARTEGFPAHVAATVTVNPKAYATSVVARTAGAALTVNANRGSTSDKWVLHISNTTGGALTVTGGTNIIFDPVLAPLVVPNNSFLHVDLAWLPTSGGVGFWYQVSKAVQA